MSGSGGGAGVAEAPEQGPPDPPAAPAAPAAPVEATVRLPVAVLAVLATVVVALLVVALVVRLGAQGLPAGPPRDPPPPPPPATRLGIDGLDVTFAELKVTLAGPPYRCESDYPGPPRGFTQLALCAVVVHRDYDGKGNSWSAATGVGLLDDTLVDPGGDLRTTTATVFDDLVALDYDRADRPRLSDVSSAAATIPAPPGRAWTQQGNLNVSIKGLATKRDRLVVFVVHLQGGRYAAFFSDFPHDGSQAALRAVVASASSLSAQP